MTEMPNGAAERRKPLYSLDVLKAAAQVAVTASKKTGRPVDPLVEKLIESE